MKYIIFTIIGIVGLQSCNTNEFKHDASGIFEATEIIVSAQVSGEIKELNITEGDELGNNQWLGYVDTTQLYLQKMMLQATTQAVSARRSDISLQIAATKNQIVNAQKDKSRIENMFADGAATQKQVDDVRTSLRVLENQLSAQINTLSTSNNSIDKESAAHEIQVAQIEDQLLKSRIINPISGTVLTKYAEAHEYAMPSKPLYKIADLKHLKLKAYVVSNQLSEIRLGQSVQVYINDLDGNQRTYKGTISWIADKAEFTPKTIQTKDERQNLVYAIKVVVDNVDGGIKIGMYGDVDFKAE